MLSRHRTTNSVSYTSSEYDDTQNRTFRKWINARLASVQDGVQREPFKDLATDFADGTRLVQLIQLLIDPNHQKPSSEWRHNAAPVALRVQKMENVGVALKAIKKHGVHLTNIGAEDVVDGNTKLILGMIWTLIKRFTIADISEEGQEARSGLLLWAQRMTRNYEGVDIRDFTRSWNDGRALIALLHSHHPDLIAFPPPGQATSKENIAAAFRAAEQLGIPALLEVEDLAIDRPDERSVMTYIAEVFHALSRERREETEGSTLRDFVSIMQDTLDACHDYVARATALLAQCEAAPSMFDATTPYGELKALHARMETFLIVVVASLQVEKLGLNTHLHGILLKLASYALRPYDPPVELAPPALTVALTSATARVRQSRDDVGQEIGRRRREATTKWKRELERAESAWERAVVTLEQVKDAINLDSHLSQLSAVSAVISFSELEAAESICEALDCGSDPTVGFRAGEARRLAGLLESFAREREARKEIASHQQVVRRAKEVKPERKEEIESVFRSFSASSGTASQVTSPVIPSAPNFATARNGGPSNGEGLEEGLRWAQFGGACAALGLDAPATELAWLAIAGDDAADDTRVAFEPFFRYMCELQEGGVSLRKVREAFASLGGGKGYLSHLDLQRSTLPASTVTFLREHVTEAVLPPEHEVTEEESTDTVWDYETFLDGLFL